MANRRTGFTLIEIMCVMVILAIAAAIVVASMSNTGDLQASAEARVMLADLTWAQSRAIATQQNVYITFNNTAAAANGIAADTYAICSALPNTYITNPISHANYTNSWSGQNWSISVTSMNSQSAMYFDALGSPHSCSAVDGTGAASFPFAGGTIAVTCNGRTVTLTVQADTGDMTVQ
jgi:prepilin-type N-terminal cleavage/methylation domain-containing protein